MLVSPSRHLAGVACPRPSLRSGQLPLPALQFEGKKLERIKRSPVTKLVALIALAFGGIHGWMTYDNHEALKKQTAVIAVGKANPSQAIPKKAIFGLYPETKEGNVKPLNPFVSAGMNFDRHLAMHIPRDKNFYDTLYGLAQQGYVDGLFAPYLKPQTSPEFQQYNAALAQCFDPAAQKQIHYFSFTGAIPESEKATWMAGRDSVHQALKQVYGDRLHATPADIQWPDVQSGAFIERIVSQVNGHPGPIILEIYGHGERKNEPPGNIQTMIGIPDGKGGEIGLREVATHQMIDLLQKRTGQPVIFLPKCCYSGGFAK